jgi:N-acyl amino acid synthase of PEP-CTERM/exosortase system
VSKQFPTLAEAFLNYFNVDLVTNNVMAARAAAVRYRVYCEEFAYEDKENFPNDKESDEFDSYSIHALITHKSSGRAAGCVRLVCASDTHQLPLELHCLDSLYMDYMDSLTEDRSLVCEFSRLAVDAAFRKRSGEMHTREGEIDAFDCSHQEQRAFSMIGIAAFLSAFALASLSGRTQIFAMMESNLPRLLRQSGVLVRQSGEFVEYHGQRAAYSITSDLALANMRDDLRFLYDAIHERLAPNMAGRMVVDARHIEKIHRYGSCRRVPESIRRPAP